MLQLLWGGAYARRRETLMRRLTETGGVLLTPEQFSHESERALCEIGGDSVCAYAEVLTFGRMAHRVFAQEGGLSDPVLDEPGRLLTLRLALRDIRHDLRVFSAASRRTGFLQSLLLTVDELKCYCLTPGILAEASHQAEGRAKDRLWDFSLLLAAFDRRLTGSAYDPRDKLTRLLTALQGCSWAHGKHLYIDGFLSFTVQEARVIRHFLEKCASVTVALPGPPRDDTDDRYRAVSRTASRLRLWAKDIGIAVTEFTEPECTEGTSPPLRHLAEHFLDPAAPAFPMTDDAIRLRVAPDVLSECRHAAAECIRLVHKHARFREIAVLAPDFDRYARTWELVCRSYGIPVFSDETRDAARSPLYRLTMCALDAVCHGYTREAVFGCLKTNLACLSPEETAMLENYVLRWNIRGSRWTADRDWRFPVDGFQSRKTDDGSALARINTLRRRVRAMLLTLRDSSPAEAVTRFWEHLNLAERLEQRAAHLAELGYPRAALETAQLWEICLSALEQCRLALEEEEVTLPEFAELFSLTLSQYKVGVIPVSLDRLQAGSLGRVRHSGARHVFILGADAESVMRVPDAPGLLTDEDRVLLEQLGHDASPGREDRIGRELTNLYSALTLGTETLTITRPMRSGDSETRPSLLQPALSRLFGLTELPCDPDADAREAPRPAREWMASHGIPKPEPIDKLTPEYANRLYGVSPRLSATRLNLLMSCHFAYFAQYGLQVRERGAAGFSAPDAGTFVHAALEQTVRQVMEGGGFDRVAPDDALGMANAVMRSYAQEKLLIDEQSPRFRWLLNRLSRTVRFLTQSLFTELRDSAFRPSGLELRSHYGVIDRVDSLHKDGELFLRVVDYKTGQPKFDFRDIKHGLGLQMLLYLFSVTGENARPAGALYWPARETLVDAPRGVSQEDLLALIDGKRRRSGLLLDDHDIIAAQRGVEGVQTADTRQFDLLRRHVEQVTQRAEDDLRTGRVETNPYDNGSRTACTYCPYAQACRFDPRADTLRYLPKETAASFWTDLELNPSKSEVIV